MKIGYEAKRAFLNNTGLGNYCRGVIKMMASDYREQQYFLYTPKLGSGKLAGFIVGFKDVVKVITPKSKLFTSLWRSKGVVKDLQRDGIDVYHGLSHELPFGIHNSGVKSVVTIHDLIFMRFPQYFGSVSRMIYAAKIKYACKHADRVIAISEKTKADLVELINTDPAKIEVLYQDCDAIFKAQQSEQQKAEVKAKYQLPDQFILSVGTIEERKNLLLLIKALSLLPNDTKLVVIGRQTTYADLIKKHIDQYGLQSQVIFLQHVAFEHLPAIYQLAAIFVYPSRYEGFGLPVLEALNSGTPVIAATGSCLEEAGGPDSLYVDPDNENDLADKIKLVLSDNARQQKMIASGLKYATRFDDKKLAAQLMQLYKNVVNNA